MWARLQGILDPYGLILRGGFHADPADDLPEGVRTVLLVGNAGSALWQPFDEERTPHEHALDIWTRQILEKLADQIGAEVRFPFGGPPHAPFQRWAGRAEPGVDPSPVMIAAHPVYGLWHAYRGAFLFREKLDLPEQPAFRSPCSSCDEKPCLAACPVDAFDGVGYDVGACSDHVNSEEGAECRLRGCLARHACPVGQDYAYEPDHAAFHMAAFLRARN